MKNPDKLLTCNLDLQRLFIAVDKIYPIIIIEGERTPERQAELVKAGRSKRLDGKHTRKPSEAADVAPYPLDWNDLKRFYFLAGIVKAKALELGFRIRWGGDWNSNSDFKDQDFNDLVHYEII